MDWIKSVSVCACVRARARVHACVHMAFVFNCVYTKEAESLILCY